VIGQFLGILIPSWIPMLILAILIELLGQLVVADAIRWSPSAGK
jgi:hypothetical protein